MRRSKEKAKEQPKKEESVAPQPQEKPKKVAKAKKPSEAMPEEDNGSNG